MTKFYRYLFVLIPVLTWGSPVRVLPENPHYLEYKGKPLLLISSAEHYGAVVNLDFNYEKYLKTLHEDGMNYTRVFTGSYIENTESFGIEKNTLAPLKNRLSAPWARSDEHGYAGGGNRFDLERWDGAYFKRLRGFVALAERYDIIVELTFFSSIYKEENWLFSPLHPDNNINAGDAIEYKAVHTLGNGELFAVQEAMVRKIVRELNAFGNVIYEIQNEPWSDQPGREELLNKTLKPKKEVPWYFKAVLASEASLDWQSEIARIVREEESGLPERHLVAQNYSNCAVPIPTVDPNIDILNFHYAWPDAVDLNFGYDRPISFDESGFFGKMEEDYLKQAWRFMLAGGAVYNNLDYSFVVGSEDGSFESNASPGIGSKAFRDQLVGLRRFLESSDVATLKPAKHLVGHAQGFYFQALQDGEGSLFVYLEGEGEARIELLLVAGRYEVTWLNLESGEWTRTETKAARGGLLWLEGPLVKSHSAVRILKR